MRKNCEAWDWEKWIPCDETAMAMAMDDRVIKESTKCYVSIELAGNLTRGQVIIDWNNTTKNGMQVEVVTELKMEEYIKCLTNIIK